MVWSFITKNPNTIDCMTKTVRTNFKMKSLNPEGEMADRFIESVERIAKTYKILKKLKLI